MKAKEYIQKAIKDFNDAITLYEKPIRADVWLRVDYGDGTTKKIKLPNVHVNQFEKKVTELIRPDVSEINLVRVNMHVKKEGFDD